ncbi:6847_t:CDS:2 [Funneliformis caledonium]|uniref:6847_t:CDS:1 n=1 Tax=Funneliformis caledonium TaxID=1117310 RepID=A0A9N8YVR3_9GLOM|nr:6847_t:CDS:2 [Funneliformis caledonium]
MYERLLWSSIMSPSLNNIKGFEPHSIINLAMNKLVSGMTYICWKKESKNNISTMNALAILGPHLCIDIVLQSEYAPNLMSNFMHFCINISDNRKNIITSMFTEPVLAEASAQIINDSDINLIEKSFNEEPSKDRISAEIEKLLHMPFLLLYMQLESSKEFSEDLSRIIEKKRAGSRKCKLEEALQDYNIDCNDTRDRFLKRIRTKLNKDVKNSKSVVDNVSDADIKVFRKYFQVPLAIFGLSSEVYSCLKQATTSTSVNDRNLEYSFNNYQLLRLILHWGEI